MDLRGCSDVVLDDLLVKDDDDTLAFMSAPPVSLPASFSRFSTIGVADPPGPRAVPGMPEALVDDPKEANAPEPSPKAKDAPLMGGVTVFVDKGVMALNGLGLPPADASAPKRFADEKARGDSVLLCPLLALLVFGVERESVEELFSGQRYCGVLHFQKGRTLIVAATGYP